MESEHHLPGHDRIEPGSGVHRCGCELLAVRELFEEQRLAQRRCGDGREEARQPRLLRDARAEPVREGDPAVMRGPGDRRHAVRSADVRLERIERCVLQPAIDDVDRFEPFEGPQPQTVAPDHEIAALREVEAHLHGQVRVLDVGRVPRSAGQHDDAWAPSARRRLLGQ